MKADQRMRCRAGVVVIASHLPDSCASGSDNVWARTGPKRSWHQLETTSHGDPDWSGEGSSPFRRSTEQFVIFDMISGGLPSKSNFANLAATAQVSRRVGTHPLDASFITRRTRPTRASRGFSGPALAMTLLWDAHSRMTFEDQAQARDQLSGLMQSKDNGTRAWWSSGLAGVRLGCQI